MSLRVSKWAFGAGALLLVVGLTGFLVAASGVIPVKASSGHWAITEWFLHFSMRRSVATHTIGMAVPPLDDPALVLKGAGHYENGCRPCHGSPEFTTPRIAAAMTPPPPYLPTLLGERKPEELFYVIKHGIKFTGMPAWPSRERDDEVWAVVAFLLALPSLDATSYRRLVDGDAPSKESELPLRDLSEPTRVLRAIVTSCARCHGAEGRGRGLGAFPKLAGQSPDYLLRALQAYANGSRHSGMMGPIAAALGPEEVSALADYYGELPRGVPSAPLERATSELRIQRGEEIATRGISNQGVPSCVDCHGPVPQRRNAAYPNLAGQYANYIELQLELFKRDARGGSAYAHIMRHVATRLSAEQMRDVAAYYQSLSPGEEPREP